MAQIKTEDSTENVANDAWLSYWSNPKKEVKKEESKPDLATIESKKSGKRNKRSAGTKISHKNMHRLENIEGAVCEGRKNDNSINVVKQKDASENTGFENKEDIKIALGHANVTEGVGDLRG